MSTATKQQWTDLAARTLGASVIYANDELFADRENLIKAADPVFQPFTFGNKGQIMDGWETRRRREAGGVGRDDGDSAIVRLGCKAVRVTDPALIAGAFDDAKKLMQEFRVPVVVEIILERVTNISMGTELDNVTEFEELAARREDAPTAAVALLD